MRLLSLVALSLFLPIGAFAADLPTGHPPVGAASKDAPAVDELPIHSGVVTEAIPAGSYVYTHVKTEAGDEWLAGPVTNLKVGSTAKWNEGHVMHNFASPSLKRTFDNIRFVEVLKEAE